MCQNSKIFSIQFAIKFILGHKAFYRKAASQNEMRE